jgi:hypothetical protein
VQAEERRVGGARLAASVGEVINRARRGGCIGLKGRGRSGRWPRAFGGRQSIGSGTEATVPAVAVPLATDVAFRVPAALTPRQYRFCREYTTSGGQTKAYVCAFAFVVKD